MSTHLYEIVKVCYAIYIMEKIDIIDVKQIRTNPFQPRQTFVQEKLEELAASIKENGLIQPIIVRKSPIVGYELLAGERRYRAAQMAGFKEIPAIIRDLSDDDMIKQAILLIKELPMKKLHNLWENLVLTSATWSVYFISHQLSKKPSKTSKFHKDMPAF